MNMTIGSDLPDWVTPVAWIYIALALLGAVAIAVDIYVLDRRRESPATELVWVASALYLGPFAIQVYLSRGRARTSNTTTSTTGTTG